MGFCNAVCTSVARLDGKTAVITGCNTGIGKVTARDFFQRGAKVIMACRNEDKAKETAEDIKVSCKDKENLGEIVIEKLDLNSLKSVRSCAQRIIEKEAKIDLLVNNAGVMMCPEGKTEDGFETQFGTNHLGHFLLTLLLLPKVKQSESARIVTVSSMAHERGKIDFDDLNFENKSYSSTAAYCQSKLANVLFTKELDRKLKESNVNNINVYSLHPGVIKTELGRHLSTPIRLLFGLFSWTIKTPEQGAQTSIYCSVDEKCANESGLYYSECAVKTPAKAALNEEDAKRLWNESLKLVGLSEDYNPLLAN
ncbi:retinol dehydrogenase 13-like [Sitophilus oryzae]|uniref:Retinol dehydrogenase 13-like n=1 Tax=Sitophilus oryzae TaxID=7048 RepID=A0A6J2XY42_SITOR|nr:retinol dehydrogenase 13-like [Sitophilus oryzae]XP_030756001.1 retinol dehydrogenase 13-like [Sitophilus oryzae]